MRCVLKSFPQASSHTSVWRQLSDLARWSQSEKCCDHTSTAAALQPQTEPSRLSERQRGEAALHRHILNMRGVRNGNFPVCPAECCLRCLLWYQQSTSLSETDPAFTAPAEEEQHLLWDRAPGGFSLDRRYTPVHFCGPHPIRNSSFYHATTFVSVKQVSGAARRATASPLVERLAAPKQLSKDYIPPRDPVWSQT